jgi:hypothetical protein
MAAHGDLPGWNIEEVGRVFKFLSADEHTFAWMKKEKTASVKIRAIRGEEVGGSKATKLVRVFHWKFDEI